jgi:hypothetical protein
MAHINKVKQTHPVLGILGSDPVRQLVGRFDEKELAVGVADAAMSAHLNHAVVGNVSWLRSIDHLLSTFPRRTHLMTNSGHRLDTSLSSQTTSHSSSTASPTRMVPESLEGDSTLSSHPSLVQSQGWVRRDWTWLEISVARAAASAVPSVEVEVATVLGGR